MGKKTPLPTCSAEGNTLLFFLIFRSSDHDSAAWKGGAA